MSVITPETARPDAHVQVVRGTPDDVELAALVAGLVAATSHPQADVTVDGAAAAARSRWVAPASLRGTVTSRGADAWRWSLRG